MGGGKGCTGNLGLQGLVPGLCLCLKNSSGCMPVICALFWIFQYVLFLNGVFKFCYHGYFLPRFLSSSLSRCKRTHFHQFQTGGSARLLDSKRQGAPYLRYEFPWPGFPQPREGSQERSALEKWVQLGTRTWRRDKEVSFSLGAACPG